MLLQILEAVVAAEVNVQQRTKRVETVVLVS